MIERLYLEHIGPIVGYGLDVSGEGGFASRLNLITGDNGLGKTFVLDALWYSVTNVWSDMPILAHPIILNIEIDLLMRSRMHMHYNFDDQVIDYSIWFDERDQVWYRMPHDSLSNRTSDQIVLYLKLNGGFLFWDATRRKTSDDVTHSPYVALSAQELWSGQDKRCNGLLRDWVVWQYKGAEAFQRLCAVMAALAPHADEPLRPGQPTRISEDEAAEIPTLKLPYGEIPVTHASAGVRRVLSLAYALCWAWEEHLLAAKRRGRLPTRQMIVLFDEVEAHLHPQWQRVLLPALLEAIRLLQAEAEVQLFATTHAPLVLASLEPLYDPARDRIYNLELQGERRDRIASEQVPFHRYGDASAWLRSAAFDMRLPMSREAEDAILTAQKLMRDPAASPDAIYAADLALRRSISDTHPFYARWDAFRAARHAEATDRA